MLKKILPIIILVVVVVGAGSFYGGMVYGKGVNSGFGGRNLNSQQFTASMAGAGQRAGSAMAGRAGGGFISGQVISQDSQSITVSVPAQQNPSGGQNTAGQTGGSKIVFLSSSTQIIKTVEGSTNDISVGSNLTITGTANSDGSITAQSIQIRPNIPVSVK